MLGHLSGSELDYALRGLELLGRAAMAAMHAKHAAALQHRRRSISRGGRT
jgi:hypothetical protein